MSLQKIYYIFLSCDMADLIDGSLRKYWAIMSKLRKKELSSANHLKFIFCNI